MLAVLIALISIGACDRQTQRELAVGDREQMGSGAATVISIGRVLSRTYQGPSAQDGW